MTKLMKYEFRKQVFSKVIIGVILLLVEVLFGYGIIIKKETTVVLSASFLSMVVFGAMFYFAFESIDTLSKDLKTKNSYMLFLTPHTSYEIIGAKVLTTAITLLVGGLAFLGICTLDAFVFFERFGTVKDFVNAVMQIFHINIELSQVVVVVLATIISWLNFIIVAFLSISLSTTFLANKKAKGFLSFGIFVVINLVMLKIIDLIGTALDNTGMSITNMMWVGIAVELVFTVVFYYVTAWLLDKKVSV